MTDGTVVAAQFPIGPTLDDYLAGLGGSPNTKKLHRQNLREFEKWNSKICEPRLRKRFVEEIDRPHLMRFMEYLMEDEPDPPDSLQADILRLILGKIRENCAGNDDISGKPDCGESCP